MLRKIRHGGVIAAAIAVGLSAATVGGAQAADTIKLGSMLAVTGGASFLGDPEKRTLEMYVEKINAEGGVLGKQIELFVYDSQGNPKKGVGFFTRLVDQDEVDAIVGSSTSGETMALIPLVERTEIPFISFAGATAIIDPVKKWVFKTPHTDSMACARIFEDLNERGLEKIGLISGTGGFGKSMRGQCTRLAPEFGIEIVADETYNAGDTDMTTQVTKVKNAAGIEAIVVAGFRAEPALVAKAYKQLGVTVPMYQSHGVASKKFIELAGDAAEGIRLPAASLLVADQLPDDDPTKPVVTAYKAAYEEKTGDPVSTFGGHAYDGLYLIVEAIKAAGSTDKAAVREALENIKGFRGTAGEVNFSPDDHLGLSTKDFRIVEIRNGDWVLIK